MMLLAACARGGSEQLAVRGLLGVLPSEGGLVARHTQAFTRSGLVGNL